MKCQAPGHNLNNEQIKPNNKTELKKDNKIR